MSQFVHEKTVEELTDAQIIDQVLQGQRERFQLLIQRYQDRVYAVAWSRLGDRALAEETVQETFIQGFRRLNQVRNRDRFGQWITAIARRRAIQLGMRHQNELRKREQWALDPATIHPSNSVGQSQATDEEPDSDQTFKEALQGCLSSLTGIHRECLSLYYLQGKKIHEAATTLGVSESAFKVRLHRARKALRSSMESVLETGLQQLKPSDKVRHSIMGIVLGKVTSSSILKSSSFAIQTIPGIGAFIFGIQILTMLPGFLFARWLAKLDIANFKDQEGYQVRVYKENLKAGLTFFLIGFVFIILFLKGMPIFSVLGLLYVFMMIYLLPILANYRYMQYWAPPVMIAWNVLIISYFHFLLFHDFNNLGVLWVAQGTLFMYLAHHMRKVEPRTDFSIFLRLNNTEEQISSESPPMPARILPASTSVLRAFADFIARDKGVMKDTRLMNGLELWMTPIRISPFSFFGTIGLMNSSKIFLAKDGSAKANLGKRDKKQLDLLGKQELSSKQMKALEFKVSTAVQSAFHYWAAGDYSRARKHLALKSSSAIFIKPPNESKGGKWKYGVFFSLGCLFLVLGLYKVGINPYGLPKNQMRLKPVATSESEIRKYFRDIDQQLKSGYNNNHLIHALHPSIDHKMVVIPSPEMIGPELMAVITNTPASTSADFDQWRKNPSNGNLLIKGIGALHPRRLYHGYSKLPINRDHDFSSFWQTVDPNWNPLRRYRFDKIRSSKQKLNSFELREAFEMLGVLHRHTPLRNFDWTQVHEEIASHQYLDPDKPFKNYYDFDIEDLVGLIVVGQHPMMDTWRSLQILDWTGGLDRIDQKACIEGILNLHYGKGRFYAKQVSSKHSPWIKASAPDTYSAFHCLRILNALDRVKDLEKWEFRPYNGRRKPEQKAIESFDYYQEIEAWMMKQEFQEFMSKR